MQSYEKVMIAVDFSAPSVEVVETGCRFAREYGAAVVLLHVVEEGFLLMGMDGLMLPAEDLESIQAMVAARRRRGEEQLEQMLAIARGFDVEQVEAVVLEGYPASTIIDEAAARGVDAIFVGSHGWAGIKRFLMGSVATNVVKNARCSVMVVRRPQREKSHD